MAHTSEVSSILSLFPLTDDQRTASTSGEVAVSVTAGAGSGKTRTLVGRYLALLESGLPLRSLLAITFTDKAAREMRNRIRAEITRWLEQCPAANRERWQEAFSALDAARISTIHSLCAIILRTHPAETGLDPGFVVLDEGQSALWRAQAVEAGLAWATTDPEAAQLFGLWSEAQLRGLLADLLEKRLDTIQALAALPADPLTLWNTVLEQWFTAHLSTPAWQSALAALAEVNASNESDKLELARREVLACWAEAQQAQAAQDWDALYPALLALRKAISTGGVKGNWLPDDLTVARDAMTLLRDHFEDVVSGLVDSKKPCRWTLDRQAAERLPVVRRLFEQTQAIYQDYKNEAQSLDFDDLEQRAAQLLAGNAAVRARWQREINAILLVDEFQDTNQRQREIVYALAGFDEAKRRGREDARGRGEEEARTIESVAFSPHESSSHPSASSPPPASLFVVGDAKQSIYRFRGADVTVFRQVQADIEAAGGALINFDLTFRAHKALVELTNNLLAPLMPAADDPARPYEVPFTPLLAHRPEPRKQISLPYLEFQLGLGENKEAGRQAAAAGLAERLHQLQAGGQIEWQDVALLFRASTAFGVYEDALERAGIPFVTIAGRGFYDRPEIRDLLNALTTLADPTDDLAMAGLLRSPAIGLSDSAIYRLRWGESGRRRSFWSALRRESALANLPEADRDRAEFVRQLVADLHAQAGRVSVAQLLKAFLDATHYRAVLRLVRGGERLRRNVDKLLADAHRSELVSISAFLEYLTALGDVGVRESEAPTEVGGAVQLMTIHKAKGLEFPLVVLADAGYTGGFRAAPFYLDQTLGLLLNPSGDESQPAAFRLAAWREAQQEAAEEKRRLYVAATRAMEKLIISGNVTVSTAKTHPGRLMFSGWLKQLAEVVGLGETFLPETPLSAQTIPLAWASGTVACTVHPPISNSYFQPPLPDPQPLTPNPSSLDLLAPLMVTASPELDAKLKERESDPPPRVWRVAPDTHYDVPAWVVGSLTHVALRHWLFPNDNTFARFLHPFALEAGLTEPASVDTAIQRVTRLLNRFQRHPLYTQLTTAERHHELPYALTLNGQMVSGIIDLLYRASPSTAWTIAEFKTDRLAGDTNLQAYAQQQGYLRQVETYQQAITQQLGTTPQVFMVFLNVGQSVQVLRLG